MKVNFNGLHIETNPSNDPELAKAFTRYAIIDFFDQYHIIIDMLVKPEFKELSLLDCIEKQYPWYTPFTGPIMDAQNYMCYPGDPPAAPIVRFTRGNETMYMYVSDFAAIQTEDGFQFSRLD